MSYAPSKAVFPDGSEMFTVGDGGHVTLDRLYETIEEAWTAHSNGEVPVDDSELVHVTSEPVIMMTKYGSGQWVEMLKQNAEASRGLLITPPHHIERNCAFGYGWDQ